MPYKVTSVPVAGVAPGGTLTDDQAAGLNVAALVAGGFLAEVDAKPTKPAPTPDPED